LSSNNLRSRLPGRTLEWLKEQGLCVSDIAAEFHPNQSHLILYGVSRLEVDYVSTKPRESLFMLCAQTSAPLMMSEERRANSSKTPLLPAHGLIIIKASFHWMRYSDDAYAQVYIV
jgi:hypothetical protein